MANRILRDQLDGSLMMDALTFEAAGSGSGIPPGRCKWIALSAAASMLWAPGHCLLVGYNTNATNIAITRNGQTFAQLNALRDVALDSVVMIVNNNSSEKLWGSINVEIQNLELLTVSNNGAIDPGWICIYYVPLLDSPGTP